MVAVAAEIGGTRAMLAIFIVFIVFIVFKRTSLLRRGL